jgi:predicted amidophosphoribosyltransferase
MPTVAELTALYSNFLLGPRRGLGVCEHCFNLTDGDRRSLACVHPTPRLGAVAPISYSVAHEQLHHALAGYKRAPQPVARRLQVELAAVLWRYLAAHEDCLVRASHIAPPRFELVTTVPSSDRQRDQLHPLARIVGELCGPTRTRHRRVLRRSAKPVAPRAFDPEKFEPVERLHGEPVLLIDDTWTTGASAQSASAALEAAGAGTVAAVVIGRHVNRDWGGNDRHLRALPTPYDWNLCPLCAPETGATNGATRLLSDGPRRVLDGPSGLDQNPSRL